MKTVRLNQNASLSKNENAKKNNPDLLEDSFCEVNDHKKSFQGGKSVILMHNLINFIETYQYDLPELLKTLNAHFEIVIKSGKIVCIKSKAELSFRELFHLCEKFKKNCNELNIQKAIKKKFNSNLFSGSFKDFSSQSSYCKGEIKQFMQIGFEKEFFGPFLSAIISPFLKIPEIMENLYLYLGKKVISKEQLYRNIAEILIADQIGNVCGVIGGLLFLGLFHLISPGPIAITASFLGGALSSYAGESLSRILLSMLFDRFVGSDVIDMKRVLVNELSILSCESFLSEKEWCVVLKRINYMEDIHEKLFRKDKNEKRLFIKEYFKPLILEQWKKKIVSI